MGTRKSTLPFPTKPLPPPGNPPADSNVPTSNEISKSERRRTLKRPLSVKQAFSNVIESNNENTSTKFTGDDNWWENESGEEYYEYADENGEIIEPDGAVAIALWDFHGERDTDLSFKKGDVITVIQRFENGWWEGESNGVIGDFPCNFVEVEEETTKAEQNQTKSKFNQNTAVQQEIQAPSPINLSKEDLHLPPEEPPPPSVTETKKPPLPPKPANAPPVLSNSSGDISASCVAPSFSKALPRKEGFMTKKGHKRRNWKVRYFVLVESTLYYFKNPGDFLAKRKPKGFISLERSTIVRIAPEMKRSNCFIISGELNLLYITAPTGEEMLSWMECLNAAKPK